MTIPSPRSPRRKHKLKGTVDGAPALPTDADAEDVGYVPDDEGADLPPGRMHVINTKGEQLRLKGHHTPAGSTSGGSLSGSVEGRSSSGPNSAPASPRSARSRSPQTPRKGTGGVQDPLVLAGLSGVASHSEKQATTATLDANSSISSLDDIVDQDILYDRAGLIDDLSQSSSTNRSKLHNSREGLSTNLTPVTERLSEETLEDVHAFSDINPSVLGISISVRSQASRANSQATDREGVLAALDECAEEDEESLEDPSESEQAQQEVILLTNMEKVDLNAGNSEDAEGGAFASLAETGGGGTDVGVGPCSGMGTLGTTSGDKSDDNKTDKTPPPPPSSSS